MRLALVYVFPNLDPGKYCPLARQYVTSYLDHPPGQSDHEIHIVVNGERLDRHLEQLFDPLPVIFHQHNNWAKDLGAFLLAANSIDCDLLVLCGSHVNFHRDGWLAMIEQAFERFGPAVGAAWASQVPNPHLRTTLFWCSPELLRSYPHLKSDGDRYFFEHGQDSIALWSRRMGFEPYQLTWSGMFAMKDWHPVTLQETLALDQHTKRDLGL